MAGKSQKNKHADESDELSGVRLDKWLWAARFCKTRAIARDLVQSGKVHYNQQRAKPSRSVELGATIKIPSGYDQKIVMVEGIKGKRQGAENAQALYSETQESINQREKNAQARKLSAFHSPSPDSRPDKKQRREIIKFKHQ
ncbi:MAG: ribosome-associated heat shock protein Hsp15 [Patiriisocius sp.]|jgi:ribosome-associated heat shock protein Hsp15